MSEFVESLKRLYEARRLDVNKIRELKANGRINQKEYEYIVMGGGQ